MILRMLSLFLLALPAGVLAQSKWESIRLDENISVTLPPGYERTVAFGEISFRVPAGNAFLQVQIIPQPEAQITNAQDLIHRYKGFEQSTLDEHQGKLLGDSTYHRNGLYTFRFQFESVWKDTLVTQENMIVLIDRTMYSFTCGYFKRNRKKAVEIRDAFMAGITIHNTSFENQLTIPPASERAGEVVGLIFRYVLLAVVALVIFLWFLKKYDQVRKIKSILSIAFLAWGSVCLFLFVGNIFFYKYMYSLLIMGGICLGLGIILRKVRVPVREG